MSTVIDTCGGYTEVSWETFFGTERNSSCEKKRKKPRFGNTILGEEPRGLKLNDGPLVDMSQRRFQSAAGAVAGGGSQGYPLKMITLSLCSRHRAVGELATRGINGVPGRPHLLLMSFKSG